MKLINDIYNSTVYVTKVVFLYFIQIQCANKNPKNSLRFDGDKICETAVQSQTINGGETLGATKLPQIQMNKPF